MLPPCPALTCWAALLQVPATFLHTWPHAVSAKALVAFRCHPGLAVVDVNELLREFDNIFVAGIDL